MLSSRYQVKCIEARPEQASKSDAVGEDANDLRLGS